MAGKEAKVKVSIDTRQAKTDLQALTREGKTTAGRIGDRINKSGGTGIGKGFGIGAGIGVGVGVVKRAGSMFGGIGDVIGEATAGWVADIDKAIGGPDARGKMQAREEAAGIFKYQVGRDGDKSGVKQFYNTIVTERVREEEGRSKAIRAIASGRAASEDDEGPLDKILDAIVNAIQQGFLDMLKAMTGIGTR